MILFLDDSEARIDAFEQRFGDHDLMIARTAEEAVNLLEANQDGVWESVWLDHDLGKSMMGAADPRSGYEVVRWIIRHQPAISEIYVHSWNPVEAQNMVIDLVGAGYIVHRWPFDTSLLFAGTDE